MVVKVSNVNNFCDVFIIGGGPAGLATAIAASQAGLHSLVADGSEPPIDKPCGEGLLPETQVALQALGISVDNLDGHPFAGIRFVNRRDQVEAVFPKGRGIGIRRTVLHEQLVKRAQECGVEFLWNTPVSRITAEGVHTRSGMVQARWIVGADGSGSRVRRRCGLNTDQVCSVRHATRRHYLVPPWSDFTEVYWGERAQAYVTPISHEEVCIVVMAASSTDADFAAVLQEWPGLRDRLAGGELGSRERGAVTLMHRLRHVVSGNVALVGDASGSVDSITGDGLRLCFCQALALADGMKTGDLRLYEFVHRRLASRTTIMGNLMLVLANNGLVRERAIRSMAANPRLFSKLLAIHVGCSTPAQVVSTGLLFGWQFLAT
jgi:menaquinone-9 beta-reductase